MRIRCLYELKGKAVVTITLTIISFIMSFTVCYMIPESFEKICLKTRPEYVWQYFSGILIHNIEPKFAMWIHMIMNFMGLIPLGIIVEKVIGSRNTLLLALVEAFVTAICFQVITWNNPGKACGISTICYAFATVGFYCIFLVLRKREVAWHKQVLFYYFLYEFIGMLSMLVNPMLSMNSLVLHLSGIVIGVIWILIMKKKIQEKISGKEM